MLVFSYFLKKKGLHGGRVSPCMREFPYINNINITYRQVLSASFNHFWKAFFRPSIIFRFLFFCTPDSFFFPTAPSLLHRCQVHNSGFTAIHIYKKKTKHAWVCSRRGTCPSDLCGRGGEALGALISAIPLLLIIAYSAYPRFAPLRGSQTKWLDERSSDGAC